MNPGSRSGYFGGHQARFWSVVSEESEHVGFFRFVILLENANETMFECLARSAFPTLDWADGVWCGLGHFSRPYIEVRDELVRYLGGLSDHGTTCFHKYLAGDHSQSPNVLGARIGRATSDEIFETLTLVQTGKILVFPVVVMGTDYWAEMINFVPHTMVREGPISPEDAARWVITDSPE